jgi:catechol 2,3-dioxygenase-like lactoylglutathione lyase family enzyme
VQIVGAHHVAISTTDLARLRAFYVETLGLPVVGGFPEHGIVFVQAGGIQIEIVGEETPGDRPAEGFERRGWQHLAWEVADVDAAYADLTARGIAFRVPPEDFPPDAPALRIAFFEDPDGNLLELVQRLDPSWRQESVASGPARVGIMKG